MDQGLPDLSKMRPLLPSPGLHKGTRSCKVSGCGKTTREGKPYCSPHVNLSPYIQRILKKIEARDAEEALLEKARRLIPRDGFFVRESVLLLRTKDFTAKSFSRRLDISHKASERLIDLLVRWGHAQRIRSTRGGTTVRGTAPRDLADGI
jgi:hypothetical protein